MSTSNQRASNIFKSSQEPNTNKKNKKRHKIPFNKIQPPINISFNLGREFKNACFNLWGVWTIVDYLHWRLAAKNTLTQAWRSLKNWWPTMINNKTIMSNIISASTTLENILYHTPWKLTPLGRRIHFLEKEMVGPFVRGDLQLFRHQIPPSIGTHHSSPCPNLGQIRNGTSWRPCVVLRASPSATCNGHFFGDFRGVVGDGRGQGALNKNIWWWYFSRYDFFPRLGFMDVPIWWMWWMCPF